MTTAFMYAAIVSAILAVILAVARDVPILHLLLLPDCSNEVAAYALGFAWLVALMVGWGPSDPSVAVWCQGAVWIGGLMYFW
jgi:hypothetical protein